ncbi:jouberin-like isoform X2 [Daktulosphaira vitifoliae]|uniref:jouberin-like isoform X2 n=1 Tax=Daktulosphaira vitifoliae TaxID=58002 RepID=UPI0021A9D692|nr:jouberin-like isoform X2 [Daktulosphaira vitifoliae]
MNKEKEIEIQEFCETSYGSSKENFLEDPPKIKPRKKKSPELVSNTAEIEFNNFERKVTDSIIVNETSLIEDQNWKEKKNYTCVPIPRPRSLMSNTSIDSSSLKSKLSDFSTSDKSSFCDSKSESLELEESVSIEISDSENIETSNKILLQVPKNNEKKIEECQNDKFYGSRLEICIFQTDILKVDTRIKHPSVIIHFVDLILWEYLKKSNNGDVEIIKETSYMNPVLTKEFNFKANKTIVPRWNENILINEQFEDIIKKNTIILFEIVDFIGKYRPPLMSEDWYRIAWAFFRPIGLHGNDNTDKKIRLQLYKPWHESKSIPNNRPMVAHWLKKGILKKYPSTLHISLNKLNFSRELKKETRLSSISSSIQEVHGYTSNLSQENYQKCDIKWEKLPGQKCKLPNSEVIKLQPSSEGCMCLKFSSDGFKLAVASGKYLNIYTVPDFKLYKHLTGHQGLIYSIRWNKDNKNLLSSSSDYTACVWTLIDFKKIDFQILPHPSYVYCAEYCGNVIITGCYDNILRLWITAHKKWILCQEAEFHKGFISSIVTYLNRIVLTADSHGIIAEWSLENNRLNKIRIISVPEIRNVIISNIQLHPAGKRLLIQTRDSVLRIIDLQTGAVVQWFRGGVNNKVQTGCALSPCGNLVFGCGEDGPVNVWEAYTGKQLAFYSNRSSLTTIALSGAVDYHPHDNILAFGLYTPARNSPIYIAQYKKNSNSDIGLRLLCPIQTSKFHQSKFTIQGHDCNYKKTEATIWSQQNDEQKIKLLKNVIQRMDSVIKTYNS